MNTEICVPERLQKFTNPKSKITFADFKQLSKQERLHVVDTWNEKLNSLKGKELERFKDLIEDADNGDFKNQRWEVNHYVICHEISKFMHTNLHVPTKQIIAENTGLSRQTVHKHLSEFETSPYFQEESKKLKILTNKLLANVYKSAYNGSIKAARLYFEMTGELRKKTNKNFYIQINNIRVDESLINSLPKDAVLEIEKIITEQYSEKPRQKIGPTEGFNA